MLKLVVIGGILVQLCGSTLWAAENGTMPWPVADAEAIVYQEKIYIFGGYSDSLNSSVDWIQEYDPFAQAGQQWRIVGQLQVPRSDFVADLHNDTVYILGGETEPTRELVLEAERWSFSTDESASINTEDQVNRIGAAGVIWDHYFIIIGGYDNAAAGKPHDYIAILDLNTLNIDFSFKGIPGLQMYDQGATIVDDRIFVFGGVRNGVSNRIYEFSFDLSHPRDIRIQPDLSSSRAAFDAVVAPLDNMVYLIGGYDESEEPTSSIGTFQIQSTGYKTGDAEIALEHPRKSLMAVYLSGQIYVFGGYDDRGEVVSAVETFDVKTTDVEIHETLTTFRLQQNYPNPFNSNTRIEFELPGLQEISLDIYSATGQHIKTLAQGLFDRGAHERTWDGRDAHGHTLPSGVYFYKLTSSDFTETRKMLLVQ